MAANDVLDDSAGEKGVAPADVDGFGPQRFERSPGDVFSVEENPAGLRLDKPRQEARHRPCFERLKGDQGNHLAGGQRQINAVEQPPFVGERIGDGLEADRPRDGFEEFRARRPG